MSLNELERFERKVHSQNGEDGVIEAIFSEIGVTNRYFVEFGCHEAEECNAALLLEQGWQGLLMDGGGVSKNPRAVVRKEFIRADHLRPEVHVDRHRLFWRQPKGDEGAWRREAIHTRVLRRDRCQRIFHCQRSLADRLSTAAYRATLPAAELLE
jgi:hypothetical protein